MKISTKQARKSMPTISKIGMALAFASVMGCMTISSALGQYNQYNQPNENRARAAQDRNQYDNRNQSDSRNRNARRDQSAYRPTYQHPYHYSQPVYAPPTTYYYPQQRSGISLQSPGISLFFPLDVRF